MRVLPTKYLPCPTNFVANCTFIPSSRFFTSIKPLTNLSATEILKSSVKHKIDTPRNALPDSDNMRYAGYSEIPAGDFLNC